MENNEIELKKIELQKILKKKKIVIYFMLLLLCCILGEIIVIILQNNNNSGDCSGSRWENVSSEEIRAFNEKFKAYEGSSVSGKNVKQLIKLTYLHNCQNEYYEEKQVNIILKTKNNGDIDLVTTGNNITKNDTQIISNKSYKVKCEYNEEFEVVTSIIIEENEN